MGGGRRIKKRSEKLDRQATGCFVPKRRGCVKNSMSKQCIIFSGEHSGVTRYTTNNKKYVHKDFILRKV